MNAEAILQKIADDAQASAATIAREAAEKETALKQASAERLEKLHRQVTAQAEAESAEVRSRMLRMAELEQRKQLLARKRELIDRAFGVAAEKLSALPADALRAYFFRQVQLNAGGNETLLPGEKRAEWLDDAFLRAANDALSAQGKPGALARGEGTCGAVTGFVLQQGGMEINCTLEASLDDLRGEMETELAALLFSGETN